MICVQHFEATERMTNRLFFSIRFLNLIESHKYANKSKLKLKEMEKNTTKLVIKIHIQNNLLLMC